MEVTKAEALFHFNPEGHCYTLGELELPSVTVILTRERILPDYSNADPYYRERGNAVHEAIRLALLEKLDSDSLTELIAMYLERAMNFLESRFPGERELICLEAPFYHPILRYAGTPDLAFRWRGRVIVPDWKSGEAVPGHAVQLGGGYLPLLEQAAERGLIPATVDEMQAASAYVVPLTTPLPKPVKIENYASRAAFRAALTVYNWRRHALGAPSAMEQS